MSLDKRVKEEVEEVRNLWIEWQGEEHKNGLDDDVILLMALKNYEEYIKMHMENDKKIKKSLSGKE